MSFNEFVGACDQYMSRGYCERCNMEKPISKGGFCPDCLTHTNTYYADQPRNDLVSGGSLRNDAPEKVISIVNELPKPRKKTQKYSREELEKERKEQLAKEIKNKSSPNYNITTIERDKRIKERELQYRLENPDPEGEKERIQALEDSMQAFEELEQRWEELQQRWEELDRKYFVDLFSEDELEKQRKIRECQYRLENPDPEEEKEWIQLLEDSIQYWKYVNRKYFGDLSYDDKVIILHKGELEKHKKRLKKVEENKNLKT